MDGHNYKKIFVLSFLKNLTLFSRLSFSLNCLQYYLFINYYMTKNKNKYIQNHFSIK